MRLCDLSKEPRAFDELWRFRVPEGHLLFVPVKGATEAAAGTR